MMKNWQPLVSLPLLAIDIIPGPLCWRGDVYQHYVNRIPYNLVWNFFIIIIIVKVYERNRI